MKTDKEIENLLTGGITTSLSNDDKSAIKAVLLSKARESLRGEQSVPSPYVGWLYKSATALASLIIVLVGTAYAAKDSLPGEPLYIVKVGVVEEIVSLTKVGYEEQVSYELGLMETRLKEIQAIAKNSNDIEVGDVADLVAQINEHVEGITETVTSEDSLISHQDKVEVLSKLSGITKAQVRAVDGVEALSSGAESLQDTSDAMVDVLRDSVDDFTNSSSPEFVNQYLSDQISDVSQSIVDGEVALEVRDLATQHLNDLNEAVLEGDVTEAVISALEAKQELQVEQYENIEEEG
jgi:hypothetical protein